MKLTAAFLFLIAIAIGEEKKLSDADKLKISRAVSAMLLADTKEFRYKATQSVWKQAEVVALEEAAQKARAELGQVVDEVHKTNQLDASCKIEVFAQEVTCASK